MLGESWKRCLHDDCHKKTRTKLTVLECIKLYVESLEYLGPTRENVLIINVHHRVYEIRFSFQVTIFPSAYHPDSRKKCEHTGSKVDIFSSTYLTLKHMPSLIWGGVLDHRQLIAVCYSLPQCRHTYFTVLTLRAMSFFSANQDHKQPEINATLGIRSIGENEDSSWHATVFLLGIDIILYVAMQSTVVSVKQPTFGLLAEIKVKSIDTRDVFGRSHMAEHNTWLWYDGTHQLKPSKAAQDQFSLRCVWRRLQSSRTQEENTKALGVERRERLVKFSQREYIYLFLVSFFIR